MILKVIYKDKLSATPSEYTIYAEFSLKIKEDLMDTIIYADNCENFRFKTAHIKGYELQKEGENNGTC